MAENQRLESLLNAYSIRQVQKLSTQDVVAQLRERGISSLDDLVAATLGDFKGGGAVAKTTFIYEQFVYKESRVLDPGLLDEIEKSVARFDQR